MIPIKQKLEDSSIDYVKTALLGDYDIHVIRCVRCCVLDFVSRLISNQILWGNIEEAREHGNNQPRLP